MSYVLMSRDSSPYKRMQNKPSVSTRYASNVQNIRVYKEYILGRKVYQSKHTICTRTYYYIRVSTRYTLGRKLYQNKHRLYTQKSMSQNDIIHPEIVSMQHNTNLYSR